jgi:hypothetical protein
MQQLAELQAENDRLKAELAAVRTSGPAAAAAAAASALAGAAAAVVEGAAKVLEPPATAGTEAFMVSTSSSSSSSIRVACVSNIPSQCLHYLCLHVPDMQIALMATSNSRH